MQIKSVLKKGEFHPVFCEDFLYHTPLTKSIYLSAVMDGCSMGESSHFSSALLGKLLKKATIGMRYQEFARDILPLDETPLAEIGKEIVHRVWKGLKELANSLMLEQVEMLSTLLLTLVDIRSGKAWVLMSGDGFLAVEGKVIESDQNNRPNYMAYHLSKDFEAWFGTEVSFFEYKGLKELTIASDGVGSFEPLLKNKPPFYKEIEAYILLDSEYAELKNSFDKKIDLLKVSHGLILTDDLSLIQMKW